MMYRYEAYMVNKKDREFLSDWVDDLNPIAFTNSFDLIYILKFRTNDYLKRNIDRIYVDSIWYEENNMIKVYLNDDIEGEKVIEIKMVGEIPG